MSYLGRDSGVNVKYDNVQYLRGGKRCIICACLPIILLSSYQGFLLSSSSFSSVLLLLFQIFLLLSCCSMNDIFDIRCDDSMSGLFVLFNQLQRYISSIICKKCWKGLQFYEQLSRCPL